jgi:hypothetical protein
MNWIKLFLRAYREMVDFAKVFNAISEVQRQERDVFNHDPVASHHSNGLGPLHASSRRDNPASEPPARLNDQTPDLDLSLTALISKYRNESNQVVAVKTNVPLPMASSAASTSEGVSASSLSDLIASSLPHYIRPVEPQSMVSLAHQSEYINNVEISSTLPYVGPSNERRDVAVESSNHSHDKADAKTSSCMSTPSISLSRADLRLEHDTTSLDVTHDLASATSTTCTLTKASLPLSSSKSSSTSMQHSSLNSGYRRSTKKSVDRNNDNIDQCKHCDSEEHRHDQSHSASFHAKCGLNWFSWVDPAFQYLLYSVVFSDPTAEKFPPSLTYRQACVKMVTQMIEQARVAVIEELYELNANVSAALKQERMQRMKEMAELKPNYCHKSFVYPVPLHCYDTQISSQECRDIIAEDIYVVNNVNLEPDKSNCEAVDGVILHDIIDTALNDVESFDDEDNDVECKNTDNARDCKCNANKDDDDDDDLPHIEAYTEGADIDSNVNHNGGNVDKDDPQSSLNEKCSHYCLVVDQCVDFKPRHEHLEHRQANSGVIARESKEEVVVVRLDDLNAIPDNMLHN